MTHTRKLGFRDGIMDYPSTTSYHVTQEKFIHGLGHTSGQFAHKMLDGILATLYALTYTRSTLSSRLITHAMHP
jgi:hypothetical protein